MLQPNSENYIKGYGKGYGKVKILIGDELVLGEGSFWRRQRRLMQPAFHRRRLAGFAEATTIRDREDAGLLGGQGLRRAAASLGDGR